MRKDDMKVKTRKAMYVWLGLAPEVRGQYIKGLSGGRLYATAEHSWL